MNGTKVRDVVEHPAQNNVVRHCVDWGSQKEEAGAGDEYREVVGFEGRDFPHDKARDEEEAAPRECPGDSPRSVTDVEIDMVRGGSQKDNKQNDRGDLAG